MEYVAFGGTSKMAVVLSAMSGTKIFQVPCQGVVWAVALLPTPKGTKLAVGGEVPVVTIIDVGSQTDELQLPAMDTTNDIALTASSFSFTDGNTAKIYGAGGTRSTWMEKPAVEVVSNMILQLAPVEEQLLHAMQLILTRHPAIVNARFADDGSSLLQYVITQFNQPKLVQKLLLADCELGLPVNDLGNTVLQDAIGQSKWHALQLLLDSLSSPRFMPTPSAMRPVNDCLHDLAIKYPLDFLQFIASQACDLQPEPEVLGEHDGSDAMIASHLVRGSQQRAPKVRQRHRGAWVGRAHAHAPYSHMWVVSAPTRPSPSPSPYLARTASMPCVPSTSLPAPSLIVA